MLRNRKQIRIPRQGIGHDPVSCTEMVKQLHETGRHAFGLYVTWFTFFVTLNFIALGWLAKRKDDEILDPVLAFAVSFSMIAFTILGARSAGTVKAHLRALRDEIVERLRPVSAPERYVASSLPYDAYVANLRIMIIALYVLLAVWVLVPWTVF